VRYLKGEFLGEMTGELGTTGRGKWRDSLVWTTNDAGRLCMGSKRASSIGCMAVIWAKYCSGAQQRDHELREQRALRSASSQRSRSCRRRSRSPRSDWRCSTAAGSRCLQRSSLKPSDRFSGGTVASSPAASLSANFAGAKGVALARSSRGQVTGRAAGTPGTVSRFAPWQAAPSGAQANDLEFHGPPLRLDELYEQTVCCGHCGAPIARSLYF
jgi:hypothetical protein